MMGLDASLLLPQPSIEPKRAFLGVLGSSVSVAFDSKSRGRMNPSRFGLRGLRGRVSIESMGENANRGTADGDVEGLMGTMSAAKRVDRVREGSTGSGLARGSTSTV
jgi:hypothetical protein